MIQASIILPTYNEVENIVPLIQAIEQQLGTIKHEIVVVDDNSPDGTSLSVNDYIEKKNKKNIHLEIRTKNRGLRQSIEHGIKKAQGKVIVWMDCDFSMPPEHIPKLIQEIEHGYDIVVGSRFIPGGKQKKITEKESVIAVVLSTCVNKVLQFIFQVEFYDFTSGFIAIKKHVIEELLPLRGEYGEYFIDLIVRAFRKDKKIKELAYINKPRLAGISKTAPTLPLLATRVRQYSHAIFRLIFTY